MKYSKRNPIIENMRKQGKLLPRTIIELPNDPELAYQAIIRALLDKKITGYFIDTLGKLLTDQCGLDAKPDVLEVKNNDQAR